MGRMSGEAVSRHKSWQQNEDAIHTPLAPSEGERRSLFQTPAKLAQALAGTRRGVAALVFFPIIMLPPSFCPDPPGIHEVCSTHARRLRGSAGFPATGFDFQLETRPCEFVFTPFLLFPWSTQIICALLL